MGLRILRAKLADMGRSKLIYVSTFLFRDKSLKMPLGLKSFYGVTVRVIKGIRDGEIEMVGYNFSFYGLKVR